MAIRRTCRLACAFLLLASVVACAAGGEASTKSSSPYIDLVRQYADNVLQHGRDVYGPTRTPLLIDGINVDTHEPATWILPDDCAAVWKMPKRWVMCNVASQQILFRELESLTLLTGDPKYRQAAEDATRYTLEHLQYKDGLLYWGGHAMIDLATEQVVGESHKDWTRGVPIPATWDVGVAHELKFHFPYYELMWKVNPEATRRFILGFWGAHVQNWSNLDMNRHGIYGRNAGLTWDAEYLGGPVPFTGKGLSFIHTGSDMMYAGALLTEFTGDQRPLAWARRMAGRYDQIREPKTGLAADVYNYYHNERVLAQFGPEFGDRMTETTIASLYGGRYGHPIICLINLAERMGPEGEAFKRLALDDLSAFARHAYDPGDNTFQMMLIDGTKLGPADVKRPGALTPDAFRKRSGGAVHFWAFALGALASGDSLLWNTARSIGRGLKLGDIGEGKSQPTRLNVDTPNDEPNVLFALLDLHRATGDRSFLQLAKRIGDNIARTQFHKGFFVQDDRHLFAKFDSPAPLALLYLEVALRDLPTRLPPYYASHSFFHCDFENQGRTYDGNAIYATLRTPAPSGPAE